MKKESGSSEQASAQPARKVRQPSQADQAREVRLWAAYLKDRNVENRNALWLFYQDLVKRVAGGLLKRLRLRATLSELVSDGQMGLLYSIEHFRPELGFVFSNYAAGRVLGAMLDGYRKFQRIRARERPLGRILRKFADPRAEDPCLAAAARELEVLKLIPEGQERDMAEAYFCDGMKMEKIARVYGVHRTSVGRLIAEALRKARRKARRRALAA